MGRINSSPQLSKSHKESYSSVSAIIQSEGQTMIQYINFQNKVNLLEDIGIEIPEKLKTIMLLDGLPDTFENFITIELRDLWN